MLGNFDWWPNREAYEWFLRNVWHRVGANAELHVFGAFSEELPRAPRVVLHGFARNLDEVWKNVDLMVNPIVSGSGVNVKVAEAIYNGVPQLCSPRAVAGLLTKADPAVTVLETPEEWIAFLGASDMARAAAGRTPLRATRELVSASEHARGLARFIRERLTGGTV
jgi:hypothetical protein